MPANRKAAKARSGGGRRTIRGDGSPQLLKPGEPGYPPNGRGIYIKWTDGRRTKRAATGETDESRARDFLTRWNARRLAPQNQSSVTVAKITAAYLEEKRATAKRPANIESALRPVDEHFGALHPSAITPAYQRAYVTKRRGQTRRRGSRSGDIVPRIGKVSDRTISLELAQLRAALNWGVTEQMIDAAPKIKLPGGFRRRKRSLSRREFMVMIQAIDAEETPLHLRTFVTLALFTGQRGIVIRHLRWEHVDFEEGQIWFTKSYPDPAGNKLVSDVPMIDAVAEALQRARKAARSPFVIEYQAMVGKKEKVLPAQTKPLGSVRRAWRELVKRAGLVDVSVHDMRRTAATLALNAGAALSSVAALLNDDERTTRKHYAHASPALLLDVVKRIGGE